MRLAGNFHPEWGCLAPAPSFMRAARVALVACAVGATAGAGVVVSLIDRPAETSVAARTPVQPVEAAAPAVVGTAQAAWAPIKAQPVMPETPPAGESHRASTAQAPATIAALAEVPAASGGTPEEMAAQPPSGPVAAAPAADAPTARKKAKTRHFISHDTWRSGPLGIPPGDYATGGTSRWAERDAPWGGPYYPRSYR
jgi:hypothetical protein